MSLISPNILEELTDWSVVLRSYEDCSLNNKPKEEESSEFRTIWQFRTVFLSGYTFPKTTRLERLSLGGTPLDETRPDKQNNGGYKEMCLILSDLFDQGRLPKQIYEICVPEGEYKKFLIQNLPRGYDRSAIVTDQYFVNLRSVTDFLQMVPKPLDILLIDISEIVYIESIKDSDNLMAELNYFYERVEALAKLGTTCIIFVNYFYHRQIFEKLVHPETIQINVYPSNVPPFWEAFIVNPPELHGRKSLFSLYSDEIPFLDRL